MGMGVRGVGCGRVRHVGGVPMEARPACMCVSGGFAGGRAFRGSSALDVWTLVVLQLNLFTTN